METLCRNRLVSRTFEHLRVDKRGSRSVRLGGVTTQSTYLFGAVCPQRGAGAALVLPACNSEAMQLHLDEIATKITPGAHAVVLLDQAGWHGAKMLKVRDQHQNALQHVEWLKTRDHHRFLEFLGEKCIWLCADDRADMCRTDETINTNASEFAYVRNPPRPREKVHARDSKPPVIGELRR